MRLRELWNPAGALTFSRLGIAAVMPYLLPTPWALPAYLFAIGTDVIDGMVARRMGTASPAGAALDGWIDKILHVNLGWALAVADRIPDWWMLAWFSREILQLLMFPVLLHRFRVEQGPLPRTSVLGRLTAFLLFGSVVLVLLGQDATVLTVLTGLSGTAAGLHYGWIHLPVRAGERTQ